MPQDAATVVADDDASTTASRLALSGLQTRQLASSREKSADVLALVGSCGPISHTKIVASLVKMGWTKREAAESITLLQRGGTHRA